MHYKHERIIKNRIKTIEKEGGSGGAEHSAFSALLDNYNVFRHHIDGINFTGKKIADFNDAAKLINDYLGEVTKVAYEYDHNARKEVFSSALEEISVYLFAKNGKIASGGYELFSEKQICTGLRAIKGQELIIDTKNVDFCIGKEQKILIEGTKPKDVRFPRVCVEVKTYLDKNMAREVYYTANLIKASSPDAKTFVLSEFEDARGEESRSIAGDALNGFFNLRDMKRIKERTPTTVLEPIKGKHLLAYYKAVEKLF